MLNTICCKDFSNKWEVNPKINKATAYIQVTSTPLPLKSAHTMMP